MHGQGDNTPLRKVQHDTVDDLAVIIHQRVTYTTFASQVTIAIQVRYDGVMMLHSILFASCSRLAYVIGDVICNYAKLVMISMNHRSPHFCDRFFSTM